MTLVVVCLLAGLTAASADGQTVAVVRGLAFGTITSLSSTVVAAASTDGRSAKITLDPGSTKTKCKQTVTIASVPAKITRTSPATGEAVPTQPFAFTLVNFSGTSTSISAGSSLQTFTGGPSTLYVGTTGNFSAARAGTYSGSFTVSLTKGAGSGC